VTATRLSALDASFLAVESADSPMHVGWVATFDGPNPGFAAVRDHLAERLDGAPRFRQKLAPVPLGLHEAVWVDDPGFDPAEHVLHAEGGDLDAIVDGILSTPLPRDRPLWQMWVADELPGGGFAMIGKMHHCMVDGAAVADLGRRVLDAEPAAAPTRGRPGAPDPQPAPSPASRLARGAIDRTLDTARLALVPARLATSPDGLRALPGLARTAARTLLPPAPATSLTASRARSTSCVGSASASASRPTTSCWPPARGRCVAPPSATASRSAGRRSWCPPTSAAPPTIPARATASRSSSSSCPATSPTPWRG
jgi:WS/DGAT/MGAT family acyltransferase